MGGNIIKEKIAGCAKIVDVRTPAELWNGSNAVRRVCCAKSRIPRKPVGSSPSARGKLSPHAMLSNRLRTLRVHPHARPGRLQQVHVRLDGEEGSPPSTCLPATWVKKRSTCSRRMASMSYGACRETLERSRGRSPIRASHVRRMESATRTARTIVTQSDVV